VLFRNDDVFVFVMVNCIYLKLCNALTVIDRFELLSLMS